MPNLKSLMGGGYGGVTIYGGGGVARNLIEVTGLAVSDPFTVTVGVGNSSFGIYGSTMGGGGGVAGATLTSVASGGPGGGGKKRTPHELPPTVEEDIKAMREYMFPKFPTQDSGVSFATGISTTTFKFSIAEGILFRRGADTAQGIELIFADCKKLARFRHVDHELKKHTWTMRDGSKILFYEKDQTIKTLRY